MAGILNLRSIITIALFFQFVNQGLLQGGSIFNDEDFLRHKLPKPAFHIVFGAFLMGIGEDILTFRPFHQLTLQEEGCVI